MADRDESNPSIKYPPQHVQCPYEGCGWPIHLTWSDTDMSIGRQTVECPTCKKKVKVVLTRIAGLHGWSVIQADDLNYWLLGGK